MSARRQTALAWLRSRPVVAAPIIGALKTGHIDDAIAHSLTLSEQGVDRLESPYTPHMGTQGISDPVMLATATEATACFKASVA